MISRIMEYLSVPIFILNSFAGIAGGIWLAFLGEWKLIGFGIAMLFTSHLILGILLMPSLPLVALAMKMMQRYKPIGLFLGYLSQLYNNVLILLTCGVAYFICTSFFDSNSVIAFIPYLLWSWGMALGPWQYMASKEPDNEFTGLTTFVAAVFYLLFLVSVFIHPTLILVVLGIWTIIQLIVLPIYNLYMANILEKSSVYGYE